MDFLPMAIWSAGFLIAVAYEERTRHLQGLSMKEIKKDYAGSWAQFFLFGNSIFFLLGVISLVYK